MDAITIIATAAVAGSQIVGTELVKEATKQVWSTFIARLRCIARYDEKAAKALETADDPEAVHQAIVATNAASDQELVRMAQQLFSELPQAQLKQTEARVIQVAKNINNIGYIRTLNQS